jgi:hypothetical protein
MWPITGSMPARRLISRRMVGVTPRLWPETKTRLWWASLDLRSWASWPRSPRSTWARSMVTPVMRSVWAMRALDCFACRVGSDGEA